MTISRSKFALALATSSCLVPAVAYAQTSPAPEPANDHAAAPASANSAPDATDTGSSAIAPSTGGLSDIVVTARRRVENLQDVPIAVTAFSSADIQRKGITDRTSLADNTPSLFTINGGYPREFAFFALRGQGPAFGSTPGVINYFAEVPNSTNIDGRVGSYFDLANVQVLAGPQGTLFGKNATGGNILFEPVRPQREFGGYVRAEYGNFSDRRIEGAINLPSTSGRLLLRVAGEIGRREGYTKDVGPYFPGKDYDNLHYESLRVGLTLRPVDGVENYTVARYYQSDTNGGGTVLGAINPADAAFAGLFYPAIVTQLSDQQARGPYRVAYDLDQFSKTRYWQIINQTSVDLSSTLKLKNIVSYSQFRNKYGYDYDSTPLPLAGQSSRSLWTTAPNVFTEELQLQGTTLGKAVTFSLGGYLDRQKSHNPSGIEQYTYFPIGTLIPPVSATLEATNRSEAVFAQATIDLGKLTPGLTGLSVTGGLRYTWEYSFVSQTIIAPPAVSGSAKSRYPSYTATLDYDVSHGIHAYITARDAYKSGGVNGPVPAGSNFRIFSPERLSDVEVGFKSQFRVGDVQVRANIAAYRGIYANIQRTTTESIPTTSGPILLNVTRSAAKGKIQGVEFNGAIVPVRGLTFTGSYSFIDGKYTKVTDASANAILAGSPFPYTPKHKFAVSAAYETGLGDLGTVGLSANYVHQSKVSTAQTNQSFYDYLPGYGVLNGNLDLRQIGGSRFDAGLFVTNLTKTQKPVGVIDFYSGVPGPGTVGLTYIEPRMFGARVSYHFGH